MQPFTPSATLADPRLHAALDATVQQSGHVRSFMAAVRALGDRATPSPTKRDLCQRLDAACQAHYRAHAVPESGADAYQHLYLQALRTVLARTDGSSTCDVLLLAVMALDPAVPEPLAVCALQYYNTRDYDKGRHVYRHDTTGRDRRLVADAAETLGRCECATAALFCGPLRHHLWHDGVHQDDPTVVAYVLGLAGGVRRVEQGCRARGKPPMSLLYLAAANHKVGPAPRVLRWLLAACPHVWDVATRNTMADKAEARAEAQAVDQQERAAAYRECAGVLREQGPGDGAERASYPHLT